MSSRIEEEFDDDFDLPLPNHPTPGAGGIDTFKFGNTSVPVQYTNDTTPYKSWISVYPIYIDAKKAYGTGSRRIARQKSCWWPHSQLIAFAAKTLNLPSFHEPEKRHPRDWENPGRVKIQLKNGNTFVNQQITTKKQLLVLLSEAIQRQDPSQSPVHDPPKVSTDMSSEKDNDAGLVSSAAKSSTKEAAKLAKAKESTTSKPKVSATSSQHRPAKKGRTRLPQPSHEPPLEKRFNMASPLIETGSLVRTVKVALKQQAQTEKKALEEAGPSAQAQAAAGKGKRKVIRVRG